MISAVPVHWLPFGMLQVLLHGVLIDVPEKRRVMHPATTADGLRIASDLSLADTVVVLYQRQARAAASPHNLLVQAGAPAHDRLGERVRDRIPGDKADHDGVLVNVDGTASGKPPYDPDVIALRVLGMHEPVDDAAGPDDNRRLGRQRAIHDHIVAVAVAAVTQDAVQGLLDPQLLQQAARPQIEKADLGPPPDHVWPAPWSRATTATCTKKRRPAASVLSDTSGGRPPRPTTDRCDRFWRRS